MFRPSRPGKGGDRGSTSALGDGAMNNNNQAAVDAASNGGPRPLPGGIAGSSGSSLTSSTKSKKRLGRGLPMTKKKSISGTGGTTDVNGNNDEARKENGDELTAAAENKLSLSHEKNNHTNNNSLQTGENRLGGLEGGNDDFTTGKRKNRDKAEYSTPSPAPFRRPIPSITTSILIAHLPPDEKSVTVRVTVNNETIEGEMDPLALFKHHGPVRKPTPFSVVSKSSNANTNSTGDAQREKNNNNISNKSPTPSISSAAEGIIEHVGSTTSLLSGRRLSALGHDGNQFYCAVCNDVGDVVCCDGCPNVYHPNCVPVDSPSRISLDKDEEPWYCPECHDSKKKKGRPRGNSVSKRSSSAATTSGTSISNRRSGAQRAVKRKCSECQETGGEIEMLPCDGCGIYVHFPSCRSVAEPYKSTVKKKLNTKGGKPICSNCRAEEVVTYEEKEIASSRKKRRLGLDVENDLPGEQRETLAIKRKRSRSVDTLETNDFDDNDDDGEDDIGNGDQENVDHEGFDDGGESSDSWDSNEKRVKGKVVEHDESSKIRKKNKKKGKNRLKDLIATRPLPSLTGNKKKLRNRPRLTHSEQKKVKNKKASDKKEKKRKKKMRLNSDKPSNESDRSPRGSPTNGDSSISRPLARFNRKGGGEIRATPAFFLFLLDNKAKIERLLTRKKPLFNLLTSGLERNELIAREGASWWVKASESDKKRYLEISMRDFEDQIILWKEEKTIREMMQVRGNDNENDTHDVADLEDEGARHDLSPEDEMLTYNNYQRLYVSTSVGSKPFSPEPGKSNNRVLLELLQDIRFHPLPMFQSCRTENDEHQRAIPFFEVHGPVSTSLGDECLGCTRGWNHFCPVLQRRFPAVEYRSKLQPPLSSLMATRVGLGFSRRSFDLEKEMTSSSPAHKDIDVFSKRETDAFIEAKCMPQVRSYHLSQPSTRADDVVQFIEEAVAMKVPEPPRPHQPNRLQSMAKKSMLSRGALPMRGRKKNNDANENERDGDGEGKTNIVRKCGRCRTIIRGDTGCIQCRRAQLVINMSKRQPVSSPKSPSKDEFKQGSEGLLKVQTMMLSRATLKESNFKRQSEGDRAITSSMANLRWNPNVILSPQKVRMPTSNLDKMHHVSPEEPTPQDETGDDKGMKYEETEDSTTSVADEKPKNVEKGISGLLALQDAAKKHDTSPTSELEKPEDNFPLRERTRPLRSARLMALNETSGTGPEVPDRQKMAEKHKEEASELHKRCLFVASSGILLAMMRRDPLLLFAEPVPSSVEGYTKIVKNPIDFGTIREKVLDEQYSSFGAFLNDARLLCTNALAFNPPGSIYSKTAKDLYDVVEIMQKRAAEWMSAIKDAHATSFSWKRASDGLDTAAETHDPFRELRKTWSEAVGVLESSDWFHKQISADFMRTKENEFAYYGSIAIRRAAAAAEASLAPYPDKTGICNIVVRRSHTEDEALRRHIDDYVSKHVSAIQLKDIPGWREEMIVRILRRVQSRRVEGRIASENGCARCDGMRIDQEAKMAMTAEAVRWGRNKKKGELDTLPRVHESRLSLSTGLSSAMAREKIEKEKKENANEALENIEKVSDVSVSVRGSRVHGWGLYADQPFKRGVVVAEYIGEYISNPVADAREKMYQEQRIQDYQFRVDEGHVIDATLRGGHGRYINHSCNPNCIAKIVSGKPPNTHLKRVLIISQRDIKAREEIVYDYQFPLELDLDERIPCNCGALTCRGFMNWDLPEKGSKNRVERTQKRGGNMRDRIRRLGRPLKKSDAENDGDEE